MRYFILILILSNRLNLFNRPSVTDRRVERQNDDSVATALRNRKADPVICPESVDKSCAKAACSVDAATGVRHLCIQTHRPIHASYRPRPMCCHRSHKHFTLIDNTRHPTTDTHDENVEWKTVSSASLSITA